MGRLATRKRCWLDTDGRITTSRPITLSATAARAFIGQQDGRNQDFRNGEDAACGLGGDDEVSSVGPILPQSWMSSLSLRERGGTHNGRSESGRNGAPRQFHQQGDSQGPGLFGNLQLAYRMDMPMLGTAEMSLAEYQGPFWKPFTADTASGFDIPFTTLKNYSPRLEMRPGYCLGDQGQGIVIGAGSAYAANATNKSGLLEAPVGGEFPRIDVVGPMVQKQTFLHRVIQSLRGVLEQNEAFPAERGHLQCKSHFSPSEVAHAISLDIPPVGPCAGTAASPNHHSPDLRPLWALPSPNIQYSTTSLISTLDYTRFSECKSTPTSPSQPSPTIFAPPAPKIDEATWREVLLFITQSTASPATGEPGLSWDDPLLALSALQNYLGLFFSRSNPSCPLLHRPSFDPSGTNTLLLVSVLMLGATYGGKEAHQMAERVHAGLRGALVSVGFLDHILTATRANPYGTTRREDMIYSLIISRLRPSYGHPRRSF